MKYKMKKLMILSMSAIMLMSPITGYAENQTNTYITSEKGTPSELNDQIESSNEIQNKNTDEIILTKVFSTVTENDTGRELFSDTYEKDGNTYELVDLKSEVKDTQNIEGTSYIYTTEKVGKESDLKDPDETIEHNGKTYQLKSKELKTYHNEAETKYVERSVIYTGIEDREQVPGLAEIVETDLSGNEVSKYMPLIKMTVEKENWDSSFTFPIKITDYDADFFILNGTEIPKNAKLIDYEDEFLEYLNLDRDYYRITSIEWDGNEYTSNGSVCRNAVAKGDKVIRDITAIYGGEMVFGETTQYAYECIYVDPENPDTTVYTVETTATYKKVNETPEEPEPEPLTPEVPNKNFMNRVIDWVVSHPIIALSIGTVFIVGIIILILFILSKKKEKEEKQKVEIIDFDKKDKE